MTVVTEYRSGLFYHTQVIFVRWIYLRYNTVSDRFLIMFRRNFCPNSPLIPRRTTESVCFRAASYSISCCTCFWQRQDFPNVLSETVLRMPSFQALFPKSAGHKTVNHSSVSRRINTMPVEFFQKSYDYLYQEVSYLYTPLELVKFHVVAVDSNSCRSDMQSSWTGISYRSWQDWQAGCEKKICQVYSWIWRT